MKKLLLLLILPLGIMAQTKEDFAYSDRLSESYITIKHTDRDLFLATHDVAKHFGIKSRIVVYKLHKTYPYDAQVMQVDENEFHIYIKSMPFYQKALVHEFIHIQQMLDGDLVVEGDTYHWKGECYTNVKYSKRHHEKDAYKRAKKHRRVTNL